MEKQIEEVMNWFDFKKVLDVMHFLDWPDAPMFEGELREKVRAMLEKSVEENYCYASTWGFTVEYHKEDNSLSLRFTIANWTAEELEDD